MTTSEVQRALLIAWWRQYEPAMTRGGIQLAVNRFVGGTVSWRSASYAISGLRRRGLLWRGVYQLSPNDKHPQHVPRAVEVYSMTQRGCELAAAMNSAEIRSRSRGVS